MYNNQFIGKLGEKLAADFLISQNYKILRHNYHSRFGEIDLIVIDQEVNQLVFIEVKSRRSNNFGNPTESLTFYKKSRLLKTIYCFLELSTLKNYSNWRIDLIGLELNEKLGIKNIHHLKNILN